MKFVVEAQRALGDPGLRRDDNEKVQRQLKEVPACAGMTVLVRNFDGANS